MSAVIYRWQVERESEASFVTAWTRLTEIIFETRGSLGSRLHRVDDGIFIAYAQWPDRQAWERVSAIGDEVAELRSQLRAVSTRVMPDFCCEMVADRLVSAPFSD